MHTPHRSPRLFTPIALGAWLALAALAGCDKPADKGNRSAGQVLDGAIAQTSKKAEEIKDSTARGMEKIEDKAKDMA